MSCIHGSSVKPIFQCIKSPVPLANKTIVILKSVTAAVLSSFHCVSKSDHMIVVSFRIEVDYQIVKSFKVSPLLVLNIKALISHTLNVLLCTLF